MPADDLGVRDLLELGGAAEVLGHEGLVAEDEGGGDHAEEFFGGHGFPEFVEEGAVINSEGGGDDLGEAVPVLWWWLVMVCLGDAVRSFELS